MLAFLNAEEVTKNSCLQCHSDQHQSWLGSHHFQAMAPANNKTVLADFNQTSMDFNGFKSEFFKKGDKFFCKTQDEKGALSVFEISHVFGVEPLQQYLVKRPVGKAPEGDVMPKTQVLPFAWDVQKKEWYHIYAHDPPAPGAPERRRPPRGPLGAGACCGQGGGGGGSREGRSFDEERGSPTTKRDCC